MLSVLSVVVPLLAYVGILLPGVPASMGLAARFSLISILLVIVLLFYPAFSVRGWIGTLLALSVTLILFGLPLSGLWGSGMSNGTLIGGILPWSDASNYFHNAQLLLQGDRLSAWGSRRPLCAGSLGALLGITQGSLPVTLAVLVFISAAACFLLTREVQKSHGTAAGLLVLAIVFLFYRRFIGTTLSESLGISLGAAGFATLWFGARRTRINTALFGIFLLTLALNVRAGAFFVLPALVLWGVWAFRGAARISRYFLLGGTAAVFLGFFCTMLMLRLIGSSESMVFSNFASHLYGLVVGGHGWQQVSIDHPFLSELTGAARTKKIYALALDAFYAHPFGIITGAVKSWLHYFNPRGGWGAFGFITSSVYIERLTGAAVRLVLYLVSLWGCAYCYRHRQLGHNSLMLAFVMGILLSVPFIAPMDADGMRAYAVTIPAAAVLAALGAGRAMRLIGTVMKLPPRSHGTGPTGSSQPVIIFGVVLTLFVLVGPVATRMVSSTAALPRSRAAETLCVRIYDGARLVLVEDSSASRSRIPFIRLSDFRKGLEKFELLYPGCAQALYGLKSKTVIVSGLEVVRGTLVWLIADSSKIPDRGGIVRVRRHRPSDRVLRRYGFYYADDIRKISPTSK